MIKTNIPAGVGTLLKWLQKGTLSLEADIQRAGDQWSNLQKSLLIHSILKGYPIPPLYFQKLEDEDGNIIYSCIEGKQRISSLAQFCSEDEEIAFPLNAATPEVEVDDTIFDLANLHFSELSDECKDAITGFRFTIYCLEKATDEEISEIFDRLNNSTPLTKIQQCRGTLGFEMSRWCREINEKGFFTQALSLSPAQARREADFEVLLQSMLLLDSRHEGYDWKGISANEVTKYCVSIKDSYNDDKRQMIAEIADYLSVAFKTRHKWLKKTNAPMVFVLAKCALEHDIDAPAFKSFVDSFSNSVNEDYTENTGSGNIKRLKTEGRLRAIASAFEEYFSVSDCRILSVADIESDITDTGVEADLADPELADESGSDIVESIMNDLESEESEGVFSDMADNTDSEENESDLPDDEIESSEMEGYDYEMDEGEEEDEPDDLISDYSQLLLSGVSDADVEDSSLEEPGTDEGEISESEKGDGESE